MTHAPGRIAFLIFVLTVAVAHPAAAQFTISGTVTGPAVMPVDSVNVFLFDELGNPIGIIPTFTDPSGFYSISGLPAGTYGVGFEPPFAARLLTATVTGIVVAGNMTVDAQLDPGVVLSGVVRDTTGAGIFDIDLNVIDRDTGEKVNTPGDNTDSTGFYDVIVPTGRLDLRWRSVGPFAQPWIPVEIRDVMVEADTTVDVTMVLGIAVSGIVQDQVGNPVFSANLDFIDAATGVKLDTQGDNTDSTGFYQVLVPIASYDIRVKPRPADRLVGAEIVGVTLANDTTVNFGLQPGFSLSGTVRDPGAAPVLSVDLDVTDATTGVRLFTPFDDTDSTGRYEVIVPPGTYDLNYQPLVSTLLVPAESLGVAIGQDTVVDITLSAGILLSGVVQTTAGLGVAAVDIDAHVTATGAPVLLTGDLTDGDGLFAVVLAPGLYDLEFEPPKATRLVAKRIPSVTLNENTPLTVTVGAGVSVSGVVTDSIGTGIRGVDVDALLSIVLVEIFTPGDNTDTLGHYEIIVPAATYDLIYRPDSLSGIPDSVLLSNVVIPNDTIINVTFPVIVATGIGDIPGPNLPPEVTLRQNYPNPFNPVTSIPYDVARVGQVTLEVYNVQGALVKVLYRGRRAPGSYEAKWNGNNERGQRVSSGIYFYRLRAGGVSRTRKMILLK